MWTNKMRLENEDEIDLFELFELLWSGKWLIFGFMACSLCVSGGFLALTEAEYESRISLKTNIVPPFVTDRQIITDFEQLFFSSLTFQNWKNSSSNIKLSFEDFSKTEVIEGFTLSKNQDDLQAIFQSENRASYSIVVRSGSLEILNDFLNYSRFIRKSLSDGYVHRAKIEQTDLKRGYEGIYSNSEGTNIVNILLSVDRFIWSVENGGDVILLGNPTIPEKVHPKSTVILGVSIILSGIIGIICILAKDAIAKRRKLNI